jgi:hypothetical protein
MPNSLTIQVFTFEELSEEGPPSPFSGMSPRDRAREIIGPVIQGWANEDLQNEFAERLSEYGFPTNDVEWSLGYCQGDGVAFYGRVDVETYCRKRRVLRRMRPLLAADPYVTIERNSFGYHYSHWNTMDVSGEFYGPETERRNELLRELLEMLDEDVKTVSRELERYGYDALEVTDEMIAEHCDANEIVFTADGRIAPAGTED